ncbi:MAG: ABC transporter ATP-binding protein [Puniceicoccaceae bacterium]|nr:MAG: ABC transporter ATP-binding protein [Puniceicoccaceae bacterium]
MAVIDLRDIHKVYSSGTAAEVHALRGVSLTVKRGEFVAIMGSSGSGKSTLMNLIGCLDRPSSGDYLLDGEPVARLSKAGRSDLRSRKIGFVFQDFHLLPRTSALENVELPMLYHPDRVGAREMRDRALQALADVGLADRSSHHPSQLSGGQQQRVAIARALVNRPSILLADEPTGNLDTLTGAEIMQLFQQLNQDGLTILLVTHEPEICRFVKRILVMRDGRLQSDKPVPTPASAAEAVARLREERAREDREDPQPVLP